MKRLNTLLLILALVGAAVAAFGVLAVGGGFVEAAAAGMSALLLTAVGAMAVKLLWKGNVRGRQQPLVILIAFVVVLFLFYREAIKSYARNRGDVLFGICIGCLAYVVASNSEPIMFRPQVANLFWIVLGLGIALIDQGRHAGKRIEAAETTTTQRA